MARKRTQKSAASNISSSANPASSSNTQSHDRSSILRSSFCPSQFLLPLFASVIQGLDSQRLRIHNINTGRLQCEHAIESNASITCLAWGYIDSHRHQDLHYTISKKKRKRIELENGDTASDTARNVVLAFGNTASKVHLFSPVEARIVSTLEGGHTNGIRDFEFTGHGIHGQGWSIGGDGRLVQWSLKDARILSTSLLPHGPACTIRPLTSFVLCASHRAYIFDPASPQQQPSLFDASNNAVHTIVDSVSRTSEGITFLTAAENDHVMNVFDADDPTLIGSLRTDSEVQSVDLYASMRQEDNSESIQDLSTRMGRPQEALIVVNKDGLLELFSEPFDFSSSSQKETETLKARMKQRTRRATAHVKVTRPEDNSLAVPLINASFQRNEIALAWVEGGIILSFQKVQWRDEGTGNLLLRDFTEILRNEGSAGLGATVMDGVKDLGKIHVDDSHALIVNGRDNENFIPADEDPDVISISSGEEDSEFEEDGPVVSTKNEMTASNSVEQKDTDDVDMQDVQAGTNNDEKDEDELGEPSFGDLIRAKASEAVDIQAAFADSSAQSLVPTREGGLQNMPMRMSLGTVLTQSLRTNDRNLLESCFHEKDQSIIRATIERLESSFAATLLQRLAERLHSRPGRAGSLMVWIQWTLVAHGGYLAGQPEVMKKLSSLHQVVKDRANSLQPLLSLKGKLDMLEAQMNLRKDMQARARAANALEEDDEDGVIYVEGQEGSDDETSGDIDEVPTQAGANAVDDRSVDEDDEEDEDDDDDDEDKDDARTLPNGVIHDGEGSDSDEEGLLDDEASSTDNESDGMSEDDVDHESVDSVDTSDAEASPPSKKPAKSKLTN